MSSQSRTPQRRKNRALTIGSREDEESDRPSSTPVARGASGKRLPVGSDSPRMFSLLDMLEDSETSASDMSDSASSMDFDESGSRNRNYTENRSQSAVRLTKKHSRHISKSISQPDLPRKLSTIHSQREATPTSSDTRSPYSKTTHTRMSSSTTSVGSNSSVTSSGSHWGTASSRSSKTQRADGEREDKLLPEGVYDATLDEIVSLLTDGEESHAETNHFGFVILLHYESFTTATCLMEAIAERYKSAEGDRHGKNCQGNCLSVIKEWTVDHWDNFNDHREELLKVLKPLYEETSPFPERYVLSHMLGRIVTDVASGPLRPFPFRVFNAKMPDSVLPPETDNLCALHFDPVELARQMTLLDQQLWSSVRFGELINLNWTREEKFTLAPSITKAIAKFNLMSKWIQGQILTESEPRTRILFLRFFVKVAAHLLELGNFNGLLQVTSALQSTPIYRLKSTFAGLTEREKQGLEQTLHLVSGEGNYSAIREYAKKMDSPFIPYVGMYLTELTFIVENSYPKPSRAGSISLMKFARVANTVRNIQKSQSLRYMYKRVEAIAGILREPDVLDNDTLYQLSYYLEPRGGAAVSGEKPVQLVHCSDPVFMLKKRSHRKLKVKKKSKVDFAIRRNVRTNSQAPLPKTSSGKAGELPTVEEADAALQFNSDYEWHMKYPVITAEEYPFQGTDSLETLVIKSRKLAGGSVERLIERFTLKHSSSDDLKAFLSGYGFYLSPRELFSLLIQRFDPPPLRSRIIPEKNSYSLRITLPMRNKVAQILRKWLRRHPYDILGDDSLRDEVKRFYQERLKTRVNANLLFALKFSLSDKAAFRPQDPPSSFFKASFSKTAATCTVTDFDAEEVARQICLGDFCVFERIKGADLDPALTDVGRNKFGPTVAKLMGREMRLQEMIRKEIREAAKSDEKVGKKVVARWAAVSENLKVLNNWHSYYAILVALSDFLEDESYWNGSAIRSNVRKGFVGLSSAGADARLRTDLTITMQKLPGIPYFPPLLEVVKEVVQVTQPEKYLSASGKVWNFSRCAALHNALEPILFIPRKSHFHFTEIDVIQDWLGRDVPKPAPVKNKNNFKKNKEKRSPGLSTSDSSARVVGGRSPRRGVHISSGARQGAHSSGGSGLRTVSSDDEGGTSGSVSSSVSVTSDIGRPKKRRESEHEKVMEMLVFGWSGVGRRSLVRALAQDGVDGDTPFITINGNNIAVSCPAHATHTMTLPEATSDPNSVKLVLLVYDITNASSVNGLIKWWKTFGTPSMEGILVGTHSDISPRGIPPGAVASWAKKNGMESFEVCSVSSDGIPVLLETLKGIFEAACPRPPSMSTEEEEETEHFEALPKMPSTEDEWSRMVDYVRALERIVTASGVDIPNQPSNWHA